MPEIKHCWRVHEAIWYYGCFLSDLTLVFLIFNESSTFFKAWWHRQKIYRCKKNKYNSKDVFKPLLQMQITVHTVKHITGDVKTKTGLIVSCTFLKVQLTIKYQTWFCSFQGLHTTFKIKWKKKLSRIEEATLSRFTKKNSQS